MLTISLLVIFFVGYFVIIFENFLHVNKAAAALVMGGMCWLAYFSAKSIDYSFTLFVEQIFDVSQIIFFLLAVMVIVDLIDSHHGFKFITNMFYTSSKKKLLWFLIVISFFMSAVLDNLTTIIVMISLLKKLVDQSKERWLIGSILVISVNAGGAWTPIGDVTTTLLWINDRITPWYTIKSLFIPSVVCAGVAGVCATFFLKGEHNKKPTEFHLPMQPGGKLVFCMGISALILIPIWKSMCGLPPFLGALMSLGILWLITDLIHYRHGEARWHLRVVHIMKKIDMSGILFFLGILLAIDALTISGILKTFANQLHTAIPNQDWIAIIIGLISSVVDNVPLVAATIGMYDMAQYPTDSTLWMMITYAAGTGGSILIIGSAAGVAFMGLEKVDFIWYLKHIAWIAFIGYFSGIGIYLLLRPLL